MCLIVWDWNPAARELLLLSNRDEFYQRPTLPLHLWADAGIYAGKDLEAMGTWLGCTASGRLAAVTNFRNGKAPQPESKSRGALVTDFLKTEASSERFLEQLARQASDYNGFNVLVFDGTTLCGFESHTGHIIQLPAGVSGVSNAGFDTPWPKLVKSKRRLEQLCRNASTSLESYLSILADDTLADVGELPSTGISTAMEHQLSAVFIHLPNYGTRASSVVHMGPKGGAFMEQTFDAHGLQGTVHLQFPLST